VQWLTDLFSWFWNLPTNYPKAFWRTVHVLIVLLVLVLLTILNNVFGIDQLLRTRVFNLNRIWLPLLFIATYALFWLIRSLYRLLGPDGPGGEFEDIERAWANAREELAAAGLGLREIPIFLVLGKTSGSLEDFFAASRMPMQVRAVPRDPQAPLHVWANREAIFVTCEGASLLPVLAQRLTTASATAAPKPTMIGEPASVPPTTSESSAQTPSELSAQNEQGEVLLLGEPDPQPMARLSKSSTQTAGGGKAARTRRSLLIQENDIVDLQRRRLRHLCKVLVRDRRPYCPINGMLILVPLAATATNDDASETAGVMQHDISVARQILQLDCPRFVILCDGENLPGFADVVWHFPETAGAPAWVLGQHFPVIPDVPEDRTGMLFQQGMQRVADALLPLVVARLWRREGEAGVADRNVAVESNIRLYEFLSACRDRLLNLSRLVARGVQPDQGRPLLAGAYVAGTGPDGTWDQAFLAGVIRRAIEHQNQVRWTPDALTDDAIYYRYAWVGYLLLVGFVASVAVVTWTWW
jgi:hypothetical protein